MISFMKAGRSSVTRFTPAAKVPSEAEEPNVCPAFRACSNHCRVTESTTYNTPNLCVPGALLKWVNIFWIRTLSDYIPNRIC